MVWLAFALLMLNVGWVVVTLKNQDVVELVYNVGVISLNILYYVLALLPEDRVE